MTKILMTRALVRGGSIAKIEEVVRGKPCNCFCIECGRPLQAKKGDTLSHHFAHIPSEEEKTHECTWKPETEVHLIAKEVILEDKSLLLPFGTIEPIMKLVHFDTVVAEVRNKNRIPDITAELNGEYILIEIAVTHFCEREKIIEFKKENKNCLEINLSNCLIYGDVVCKEDVRQAIKESKITWLSVSPCGDLGKMMGTFNRKKIYEMHNIFKLEKSNYEADIEITKKDLSKIKNIFYFEKNMQNEYMSQITQMKQYIIDLNGESQVLKEVIENYQHRIDKIKFFKFDYSEKEKNLIRIELANNKQEEYLSVQRTQLDLKLLEFEPLNQELNNRIKAVNLKEKEIESRFKDFDNKVYLKAMELAEDKFSALCKQRKREISLLDERLELAEKNIQKAKNKYGSFIKV